MLNVHLLFALGIPGEQVEANQGWTQSEDGEIFALTRQPTVMTAALFAALRKANLLTLPALVGNPYEVSQSRQSSSSLFSVREKERSLVD